MDKSSRNHLELNYIEKYLPRKKRLGGGGYSKPPTRDVGDFVESTRNKCAALTIKIKARKIEFQKYYNPKLIFKIIVNQNVDEDRFIDALWTAGINVIAITPDKSGFFVYTDNDDLDVFKAKLDSHRDEDRFVFFNAIEDVVDIEDNDKIGPNLLNNPFSEAEQSPLNVDIWYMPRSDVYDVMGAIDKIAKEYGGEVTDHLFGHDFCLVRVDNANKKIIAQLLKMPGVALIDRPFIIKNPIRMGINIEDIEEGGLPADDAPGILILDSGILSNHPLLQKAVADEIDLTDIPIEKQRSPSEEFAHGTKVAGFAEYGNVEQCLEKRQFITTVWIFSSKIMSTNESGEAFFSNTKLVESQVFESIRWVVDNYPNCRIVNISFGDDNNKMFKGKSQFDLASLIDKLSSDHKLIFVISAGNNDCRYQLSYPEYLFDAESSEAKIIDPASSALAITVGAIEKRLNRQTIDQIIDHPSTITRVGPGLNGMIKPELVENGGSTFGNDNELITLNPDFIKDGKLFCKDQGTSYCAPKIANYLANIMMNYPTATPNLVKALLISAGKIPVIKPEFLSDIDICQNMGSAEKVLNIYGYGIPNIEKALYSDNKRVLLIRQNTIDIDCIQLFYFYLPSEFKNEGEREISVTLVYDPMTNKNRASYFGVSMEFHLFKNTSPESVVKAYSEIDTQESAEDELVPESIELNEIKLYPSVTHRKKGVHQKGWKKLVRIRDNIDCDIPLILAVVCRNKFMKPDYKQDFAIVVAIEHSGNIDLLNKVELKNRQQIRIEVK